MQILVDINFWLGFAASLLALGGVVTSIFIRFKRQKNASIMTRDGLRNQLDASQQENKGLQKELDDANNYNPSKWLEQMERERDQENYIHAIAKIKDGLELISPTLSVAALELAEHHAGLIASEFGSQHAARASYFATLATLLDPNNIEAKFIEEELDSTLQEKEASFENLGAIEADPRKAQLEINAINSRAIELLNWGKVNTGIRILKHSERIAKRAGVLSSPVFMTSANLLAEALSNAGKLEEALKKVEEQISTLIEMKGGENSSALYTFFLEAQILHRLGKQEIAEEKLSVLISKLKPDTPFLSELIFKAKYLKAEILSGLTHYEDAIKTLNEFQSLELKSYGKNHPNTYATSYLEATILHRMGKFEQSAKIVKAILPKMTKKLGKDHLSVLAIRSLEVRLLNSLGRKNVAREKLRSLIPETDLAFGEYSGNSLSLRSLDISMLIDEGDFLIAKENVDKLIQILTGLDGKNSEKIEAHLFKIRIESELGDIGPEIEKLEHLIVEMTSLFDPSYPQLLAAKKLLLDLQDKIS